jgi:hypothetical protein
MQNPVLFTLKEQAAIRNQWLAARLKTILPALMTRENIDLWLIIGREYNEDPVLLTMLPQPAMSARRRTILALFRQPDDSDKAVDCLSLDRYGLGEFFRPVWEPDSGETQYACLARLIAERQPQRIGINTSANFAFADGLSHSEHHLLTTALAPADRERLVSAERLCVGWLETRLADEITAYTRLIELGHSIIATAFSSEVIHPGLTHTEDVVWWMRQRMESLGLRAWFQPTVELQAPGHSFEGPAGGGKIKRTQIQPGDLLHCDMGFHYLGLATDQQQHAYVLRPGETAAPDGLHIALRKGNRLQNILLAQMQVGQTGNEVLRSALKQAQAEGLTASIYSHPLGYHGHAAGPTIGLWDQQNGVPGTGDYPLFDQTVYSIELNIQTPVREWDNQPVRIALEEDAVLTDGQMRWLGGRQTNLHLVGPVSPQ